MAEFTGERVIPGLVDEDLFHEHVSRYKFAARFLHEGASVLDLGCGTGYGSREFANAESVTGVDIGAEAVAYAREHFARTGVEFLEGSCTAVPLNGRQFELITAFEVIEHLEDWRGLLREAHRLLAEDGTFVVSTPNKRYYAESRRQDGPNPFHVHEFERDEFEGALREYFPEVGVWTQNHTAAIVFAPDVVDGLALEAEASRRDDEAHFFVAVCRKSGGVRKELFAWAPQSGNVLRERELHIAKLEGELAKKDAWLQTTLANHATLQAEHERTVTQLEESNRWAAQLNARIGELDLRIAQLQREAAELEREAAERLEWIRRTEADIAAHRAWAGRLEGELAEKTAHVRILLAEGEELKGHITHLQGDVVNLKHERALVAQSRWIRLGKTLHVGPVLPDAE